MKCVDADSLVKALAEARDRELADGRDGLYLDVNSIIELIQTSPAVDVASVVKCKECVYYNESSVREGFGWCEEASIDSIKREDFFCGYGEKKDG